MIRGNAQGDRGSAKRLAWMIAVAVAFMIVLAFRAGREATHDLTWTPYVDMNRDASFVHSIQEGHYGEDPLYRDEVLWFTPLLFAIEAVLTDITGLPVNTLQATAGAFLNLLVPVAFFLFVRRLFGPTVALVSLTVQLFLVPGQEPGWAVASYSPWLLPVNFFQAFFYLELLLVFAAIRSPSWWKWALAGTGAGLLFMGHAAPALLAVLVIAVYLVQRSITIWRNEGIRHCGPVTGHALAAGAAFLLISLPLTWYVVGVYGLDQVNRVPASYTYYILAFRNLPLFLYHNLNAAILLGLLGLLLLVFSKSSTARWMVMTITLLCLVLGLYVYLSVLLHSTHGLEWPTGFPSFHFYVYLKAMLSIGAGIVVVRSLEWVLQRWGIAADRRTTMQAHIVVGLCVLTTIMAYPAYAHRPDLEVTRQRCLIRIEDADATDMYERMRALQGWDAVTLCPEDLSMWIVMASARRTVATNSSMANPYVPPAPREEARDAMMAALTVPDPRMEHLLEEYHVSHLLVRTADLAEMPHLHEWFPKEVHRNDNYVLYARR